MIKLTRINKSIFYLNPDLIKSIEEAPDTTIELVNGDRLLVREKAEEIVTLIVAYRVRILCQSQLVVPAVDNGLPDPSATC